MADYEEQMLALQKPLQPDRVVWRVQQSGFSKQGKPWAMVLAYMDNRAVQERFDEVFGIAGWKNEFKTAPDGGTLCGISVKFGDEWVTKWDGAENTQVEAVKGGLSGSMKRAAVQWGVGRYLYDLPTSFAQTSLEKTDGWNKVYDKKQERTFGGIIHSFQVGLYLRIQRFKIQKLTLLKKRYQLHLNYMLLVKIKRI
ncbi:Rad52/Rad22 family DNA repair protein [Lactococcus lactis]